jgi:hypothetical protein
MLFRECADQTGHPSVRANEAALERKAVDAGKDGQSIPRAFRCLSLAHVAELLHRHDMPGRWRAAPTGGRHIDPVCARVLCLAIGKTQDAPASNQATVSSEDVIHHGRQQHDSVQLSRLGPGARSIALMSPPAMVRITCLAGPALLCDPRQFSLHGAQRTASPREPATISPSTPESICHWKCRSQLAWSSSPWAVNLVVTAGKTPCHLITSLSWKKLVFGG